MSDYSSENPVENTQITRSSVIGGRRSVLLPWVLFGITAGVLAALTLVLLRSASSERARADVEAQAHANEVAHAERAELALKEAKEQLAPLEDQVKALTAEKDALTAKVAALEGSKPAEKPEPKKPVVMKKTSAKKPAKKKHR